MDASEKKYYIVLGKDHRRVLNVPGSDLTVRECDGKFVPGDLLSKTAVQLARYMLDDGLTSENCDMFVADESDGTIRLGERVNPNSI
jgi:hypothetical protein